MPKRTFFQHKMDHFHKLLDLVDRNANNIPEGDYVEICKVIHFLYEKVKPPFFLLDQNEPVTMPVYEPTTIGLHELHAEWAATD
jgi:hypothetical protein